MNSSKVVGFQGEVDFRFTPALRGPVFAPASPPSICSEWTTIEPIVIHVDDPKTVVVLCLGADEKRYLQDCAVHEWSEISRKYKFFGWLCAQSDVAQNSTNGEPPPLGVHVHPNGVVSLVTTLDRATRLMGYIFSWAKRDVLRIDPALPQFYNLAWWLSRAAVTPAEMLFAAGVMDVAAQFNNVAASGAAILVRQYMQTWRNNAKKD